MTPQEFLDEFGTLAEAEGGVSKLRELILELAVRGKLVEQDDEAAPDVTARETDAAGNPPEFSIPENWVWSSLLKVASYVIDCPHSTPKWSDEGRICVRTSELNPGFLDLESARSVTDETYLDRIRRLKPECDDILYCREGRVGCACRIPPNVELCLGQRMMLIRAAESMVPQYFEYVLNSPLTANRVAAHLTGMTAPRVNVKMVKDYWIPVPPLAEQHRIVAKVDELMRLCDGLEAVQKQHRGVRLRLNRSSLDRLTVVQSPAQVSAAWQRVCDHFQVLYDTPETLPDLRQTILQLAVQGKLVKQDPNDEPAEELLGRVAERRASLVAKKQLKKSKALPELDSDEIDDTIPPSWVWTRLGNCCLNITDGFHSTPKTIDSGIPLLMAKNVKPHCLDFSDGLYVSGDDHQELVSKTRPKRGDILVVNIGAGSGTPAVIDVDFEFSFKNVAILNRTEEVDSEYLFTFLLATQSATFAELTQGGAQPFLSLTRLRSKPFPLPPLSEQKRIVSKVTDLLSQVTRLESTLTRREATRTQLLTAAIHFMLEGTW